MAVTKYRVTATNHSSYLYKVDTLTLNNKSQQYLVSQGQTTLPASESGQSKVVPKMILIYYFEERIQTRIASYCLICPHGRYSLILWHKRMLVIIDVKVFLCLC